MNGLERSVVARPENASDLLIFEKMLVEVTGLEPATSTFRSLRSQVIDSIELASRVARPAAATPNLVESAVDRGKSVRLEARRETITVVV
ncbi:MAG: hypothetical protein ACRDZ8_07645, partial [Acidimicrobiales bacterium]